MAYRIGAYAVAAALVLLAAAPSVTADPGLADDLPLDGTCDDPGCLPGSGPGWTSDQGLLDTVRDKLEGTCDDPGCLPGSQGPW